MKMHENEYGLRIDLNAEDIEEFIHVNWIELNGSDVAENIVCAIAKECEEYLRRRKMKTVLKIALEEPEIVALDRLGDIDCTQLLDPSDLPCTNCPLHLDGEIKIAYGRRTSCLSLLCKDIVKKECAQ